jgi:tetratricopeptide (TPR) repeat protein
MLYPHPGSVGESWPWWAVAGSALFLLCATWGAVWQWRRRPYLAVGWFLYLGMLVPVIGLVQVGLQAMADRYTYLPLIGVFVAVSWGVGEVAARPGMRRRAVCAACAGALLLLSSASWVQAGRWRDSITLFSHALRVTQRNWLAHTNMGIALQKLGRIQEAVVQYREAIRIYPGFSAAHVNLGAAVAAQGRYSEAISEYRQAIRLSPRSLPAHINLGAALGEQGRYEDAVAACMEALKIDPYSPVVHDNLGNLLVRMGLVEEGIGHIREALRLQPDYAKARESLYRAVSVRDIRRSTGKLPGKKDK